MLAFEMGKAGLKLDILSCISVGVYCLRKVFPPPPCPQTLQTRGCRILYLIMSIYMALPKPQKCRISEFLDANIVKGHNF